MSHLTEMGVRILPLFRAALCYQSSYAQPTPIPTPRFGSDGGWGLTMWVRCKKKDLAAADGSRGGTSELVFQAENRSPPFLRRRHVLLYAYRLGDRLPCGIVRGVHFVGSARVHVLNLAPSLRWYCGVVVVSEFPAAMGNLMLVDSISLR